MVGVRGWGSKDLLLPMYQRSILEFKGCVAVLLVWEGRKEAASKTSSMSFLYVIEVVVPETPVMVQPCSFSIASTLPWGC